MATNQPKNDFKNLGLTTNHSSLARVYALAQKAAATNISILIGGETGVGKDVLARAIHSVSPRAQGPFTALNCAALSQSLIESELFGHEKGAFTGALTDKAGLLEQSTGGTFFLDEIGEASPALQAKLLRAVESREVLRVGGRVGRRIDVRFITATNRDLSTSVLRGEFRADLLYRLAAVDLVVPPLRERVQDLPSLATFILKDLCRECGRSEVGLSLDALELLQNHSWPGNIRELRNTLWAALTFLDEGSPTIESTDISLRAANSRLEGNDTTSGERQQILKTLDSCGWNQSRTAKALGISRTTLVYRLTTHKIPRPQKYV